LSRHVFSGLGSAKTILLGIAEASPYLFDLMRADAARAIARAAGCAVLVKGGHLRGRNCYDVLADAGGVVYIGARRSSRRLRGTGCLLAVTIAAERARGAPLHDAIAAARDVVARTLRDAKPLGDGTAQF